MQRRAARSPVPGAPRRLAVDGDDLSAVGAQTFHPGDEGVPERRVIRLVWRGALAGLLDRLAALSGYDWTWRERTVVFYRYWDIEQRAAAAGSADRVDEVAPDDSWHRRGGCAHKTLRGVLESWARQAGWTLVWNSARDYAVGSSSEQAGNAVFSGGFLEAVDQLLAGDATRRALSAFAYKANRHLVIEDAGAAGR